MTSQTRSQVQALELTLHNHQVGFLISHQNGKNIFNFSTEFKEDAHRPTFSLVTHPQFPKSYDLLSEPWVRNQRLHPVLSNLLPEGALRALIAQSLKIHIDHEFQMLSLLGHDLPGALIAKPADTEDIPKYMLKRFGDINIVNRQLIEHQDKFSLAGVQMKFSMKEQDGRYNLSSTNELGDWIIKTPSTRHQCVPLNEYTAMSLAESIGVNIPKIKLVKLEYIDQLPSINLPNETYAFAIKRFDRHNKDRIHMEDFAQVLLKYPHEKYSNSSYEQVGRILYQYSGNGLEDVQQFVRRLLVNILLANGDAHLKNWSLIYDDQTTPRLSPAYDILTTQVYMDGEEKYALNLGKTKSWYKVSLAHFKRFAEKSNIPWKSIISHLTETVDLARAIWPEALETLPMLNEHKAKLKAHWQRLHPDFRISRL